MSGAALEGVRLDIVSDVACPWCYIGKAGLDRALAEAGSNPFAIRWRPFQLAPDLPPEGLPRADYLDAKFGGPEAARAVYARVEAAARAAGLRVDLGRMTRAPNTLDAHRLLRWAEAEGVQHALAEALFRRFFAEGEDISDRAVLAAAAAEAGMDAAAAARRLTGGSDREAVRAEAAAARAAGVAGVPLFVLGGRQVLSGAQPAAAWVKLIKEFRPAAEAGRA